MNAKPFRYNRSDFGPLPVKLDHMDIFLSFLDGRVEGVNTLRLTTSRQLSEIRLEARDIEIRSVELVENGGTAPLVHEYQRDRNILVIKLPAPVQAGVPLTIRTAATCVPSGSLLEGIYKDTTPPGCPQQYISQCQQWGFQRILPVFDDCTAKCTMTTTIEADARYTHLISNGDVCRKTNPDGKPVLKPGDQSRKMITYENRIPMAPYLFAVCVGTWDMLEDEVVYPSGRRVKIEYLVPPGRKAGAVMPMKIIKDSILWQGRTQEYEYEREVYRTICMEKSNFGGMENVGNTTIVTDAALIDEFTGDRRIEYAYGVIAHEYEHNQCGSDVTMETPFDMWLNEAFTVDVDRQYLMSQFDPDGMRLDEIDSMRAPISGPLAIEDAGHFGNIVRDGFNDPDELVDGLTYVKGAEVIRMLRLALGEEVFRKGKNLYFARHKGGNANTDQFFRSFEEAGGVDLSQFKREWLYTIGYPKVESSHSYNAGTRTLSVTLKQERTGKGGVFHVPLEMAAVDASGRDIPATRRVVQIRSDTMNLEFAGVPEPAFLSFNRDCSFYGTFLDTSITRKELEQQVRLDPNRFNRVEAMRRLTDMERIGLIHDLKTDVGEEWLNLFASIVRDTSLPPGLKAYLLRLDEQSLDRRYTIFYRERYRSRLKLLRTVAKRCLPDLLAAYRAVDTYRPASEPKDGVDERRLKSTLLRIIVEANTPEVHKLAEDHFHKAWNITDRISALACINVSEHPHRLTLMAEGRDMWKKHLSAYASYLQIVGGGIHDDVFDMIAAEESQREFVLSHPTHNRALYLPMSSNNLILWTDKGIDWVADKVIKMATINENTANRLVACFQYAHQLAPDLKPVVLAALERMRAGIDSSTAPSTAGRISTYLEG